MRYFVVFCSVLMGFISLIQSGNVVVSVAIGGVIGVLLYGLYIVLISLRTSVSQIQISKGIFMTKFIWVGIFFVAVIINALQSNFTYALGFTIPWFIIGMVFSPIWWGVTKKIEQNLGNGLTGSILLPIS